MQKEIHPQYQMRKFSCTCGNVIEVGSTAEQDKLIDVCDKCHPFYTGKQKTADTGGRRHKFSQKYGIKETSADDAAAN